MNDKQLLNDIEDLLRPQMGSTSSRKALVQSALWGCNVLDDITWEGPAGEFTTHLVTTLLAHGDCEPGTPAVVTLLAHARDQRGSNWHPRYNALITRVQQANASNQPTGANLMDKSQLISFLVTTGLWIQQYLNQKATLRRQDTTKDPIPLADKETMQAEAPAEIDAAGVDVAAVTQILELKHNNIMGWLKDKERVDAFVRDGSIPPLTGANQKEALEAKIRSSLEEIPTILERAGMVIDQE